MKPTKVLLRNGDTVYCSALTYQQIRRLVEIGRRRGDEQVRLNGRIVELDRIASVEPPKEPAQ